MREETADRTRSQGYEMQKGQEPGQCDGSKPKGEEEQENIIDKEPFSGLGFHSEGDRRRLLYFIPQENHTTIHLEEPKILNFVKCTELCYCQL